MPDGATTDKGVSAQRLKSFIQRIERLEEERKTLGADIREVYAEAKSSGFDVKIMRQVIKLRKMDATDRQEQESLLQVYLDAVGEVGPLSCHPGQANPFGFGLILILRAFPARSRKPQEQEALLQVSPRMIFRQSGLKHTARPAPRGTPAARRDVAP